MGYKLKAKEKIAKKSSRKMIMLVVKKGKHGFYGMFSTDKDVIDFFGKWNLPFTRLVEECRYFVKPIPGPFEVYELPFWKTVGGAEVTIYNKQTGEEIRKVKYGEISTSNYMHLFYSSQEHFLNAIEKPSYGEFLDSLIKGISSIEAYFIHRAEIFNRQNPPDKHIIFKGKVIRWDERFNKWIPTMTGKEFNKNTAKYNDFYHLKEIRNKVHPDETISGVNYEDLIKDMNRYRSGIAGILIDLHLFFDEPIPVAIIKASFYPDIELVIE